MVTVYNEKISKKINPVVGGIFFIIFGLLFVGIATFVMMTERNAKDIMTGAATGTLVDDGEHYDSDGDLMYSPIYEYSVDGKRFNCKTSASSSSRPEESSTVYYDPANIAECQTDYSRSGSAFIYILFYILGGITVIVGFFVIFARKKLNTETA